MNYKQTSDRLKCEYDKTFKGLKNKPPFKFIMRLNKLIGTDETVRQLGHLREAKSLSHIKDFVPYMMKICKPFIINPHPKD
jgi:hypothetical protein